MTSTVSGPGTTVPGRPWYRDTTQRLLFAGSLLDSFAFFGTMPFLTLYLSDLSAMTEVQIGMVVGSAALIPAFGGFAGGTLGDRIGALGLVQAGVVTYVVAYALLAVARELPVVIALVMLLGVARLMVEPSMKKIMSQATEETDGAVFRLRYLTWCIGAVVGPAIGAAAYAVEKWLIFVWPALVFLVFLLLLRVHAPKLRFADGPGAGERVPWARVVTDRLLLRVVAAGFVLYFVFKQLDSMLPLFIKAERGASAVGYYSVLLAVNAVLGILFQFPVARMSKRISTPGMALLGSCAFAAAFLFFAALPFGTGFLFAGIAAWTLGEVILIPLPDMVIHQNTPNGSKGAYFGLAELRFAGFFLGPVVGGAILGGAGSWTYFISMALCSFGCWALLRAPHLHRVT
ncbi:MFS transporter [Streptomyces sp. NBC_01538]|uniref:MFS transporter n=1 Tax=Streptomyces sp. NBC_01538 TaxID=2903897 RepID=UPI00386A86A0